MPLLDLWKSDSAAVSQLTIEQVLSAAGDGQLKDGSVCSRELRQFLGDIEAQVRGSRHAWDMRLISVDALVRLVTLKESSEEEDTLTKIRSLLVPLEYTRVDNIIDVMFATAKDVADVEQAEPAVTVTGGVASAQQQRHTPMETLQAMRGRIIAAMSTKLGVQLIAQKRAIHRSGDGKVRVACTISKPYEDGGYWYAYHPAWENFLAQGASAFFVLGCVDQDVAYAVPHDVIRGALDWLHTTVREDGKMYWHLVLERDATGSLALSLPKKGERLRLLPYSTPLPPP